MSVSLRRLLKEGSSSGKVRLRMAMGDEVAGTEILSPFAAGETEVGAGQMNKPRCIMM